MNTAAPTANPILSPLESDQETESLFTASRLASGLGMSETAVRKHLSDVPPTDTVIIKGQPTNAWKIAALPAPAVAKLRAEAQQRGLRNVADLAADAKQPWSPSIPMSMIAPKLLIKAGKRRRAFYNTVHYRINSPGISNAELARLGMPEFQRELGFPAVERGWIGWLDLICQRDNGFKQWDRLQIYLDRKVYTASAQPAAAVTTGEFEALAEFLSALENPAKLSDVETLLLWQQVFEAYDASPAPLRKPFKRRLVKFLCANVGGWNGAAKAVDKKLRRDFRRWIAGGKKPIQPQYAGRERGPDLSQAAHDAIVAYAVLNCDGRVSQAFRDYMEGEIPNIQPDAALLSYYALDPKNKSWVPPKIREAVKHEIASMQTIHHSRRQYDGSAHLQLDDSKIAAGDWWCSDDGTLPVYSYIPDGDWFKLIRGQCLLTVDHRSRRTLSYVLIPEANYNSIAIRNHVTACADAHGLPRRGFIWERGIWLKSKLLKGDSAADVVQLDIAELGLQGLGLRFLHRTRPQGKIVENVFGRIQDLMEGEPGYCGRDERYDGFEAFQKLKLAIERRAISPVGKLYSFDRWFERLGEICVRYNRARQDGKLGGLSPDEAYEKFQDMNNPPVKFDAATRHLLSTHKRAVRVTDNGITIQIGKQKFVYRNRQTGELKGRTVLAWFNSEDPSVLCVTDIQQKNAFAVERVQTLNGVDDDPQDLAAGMQQMREHQAPVRARYHSLKAQFQPVFRKNLISPETAETGRQFAAGAQEIKQVRRAASRSGIRLENSPRLSRNRQAVADALTEGQAALDRIEARERNQSDPAT
jgi:hypothetical protein